MTEVVETVFANACHTIFGSAKSNHLSIEWRTARRVSTRCEHGSFGTAPFGRLFVKGLQSTCGRSNAGR